MFASAIQGYEEIEMNTYKFHDELPLMRQRGRILKAPERSIIFSAVELLEAAKAEAQKRFDDAEAEWKRQQEAGYRQGNEDARRQTILHHWKTIANTVAYLETLQEQMVETIVQIVRTLIQAAPPAERVLQLASAAIDRLRQQSWVVLCVHPEDIDGVNSLLESWKGQLPQGMRVETRSSEDVGKGDCVLESPIGRIDASLETQLSVIQEQMQRTL